MISPPSSPTFTFAHNILRKPRTRDENPARSQKSVAQHEEDQTPQPDLKHYHLHPDNLPSRRAPLDPLSAKDVLNRHNRATHSADSASSYHSSVAPSVPDLRVLLPEQPVSSGCCSMRPSGTLSAPACSWPPPVPAVGSSAPSHSNSTGQQPSPGVAPPSADSEKKSSRATVLESSTSTWNAPDHFQAEPTTTMSKQTRTSGWKSDNLLQPIRSRTIPMPSVRRPPGELWQSDSAPAKAMDAPVDTATSLTCLTPPGLPPRQPDLRRKSADSDLHSSGSLSLSLALNSQPLRASEHTKTVPPIGAERGWAVSTTPHRNPSTTQPNDPSQSPRCSSLFPPGPQLKWDNGVYQLDTTSLEKVQAVSMGSDASEADLERLLRHAVRNKYAPKIISPLSPLRAATPVFDLITDPEYQLRMPSVSNNPSARYSKCPSRRARTVCDGYQTLDWEATCMHCIECKRDTMHKRLLVFRHRQQQTKHLQRHKLHAFSPRGLSASAGVDTDRLAVANHLQEAFAYAMDEEEKRLWEEISAITGAGPLLFSRVGAPCATAANRRAVDDIPDEGHDDYLDISDEGLRATESVTLFRDVTVY